MCCFACGWNREDEMPVGFCAVAAYLRGIGQSRRLLQDRTGPFIAVVESPENQSDGQQDNSRQSHREFLFPVVHKLKVCLEREGWRAGRFGVEGARGEEGFEFSDQPILVFREAPLHRQNI